MAETVRGQTTRRMVRLLLQRDDGMDLHQWMDKLHHAITAVRVKHYGTPKWRRAPAAVEAHVQHGCALPSLLTALSTGTYSEKSKAARVLDSFLNVCCPSSTCADWLKRVLATQALPSLVAMWSGSEPICKMNAVKAVESMAYTFDIGSDVVGKDGLSQLIASLVDGSSHYIDAALGAISALLMYDREHGDHGPAIKMLVEAGALQQFEVFLFKGTHVRCMCNVFSQLARSEPISHEEAEMWQQVQAKEFVVGRALPIIVVLLMNAKREDPDTLYAAHQFLADWSHFGISAQISIASCGGVHFLLDHADWLEEENLVFVWDAFFNTRSAADIREVVDKPGYFWLNAAAQAAHVAWRRRQEHRALVMVIALRVASGTIDINRFEVDGLSQMIHSAQEHHASHPMARFDVLGSMLKDAADCAIRAVAQQLFAFVCGRLQRNLIYKNILQYI